MKKELQKSDARAQKSHKENTKLLHEVQRKNVELEMKDTELEERDFKLLQTCTELEHKDHELKQKCKELDEIREKNVRDGIHQKTVATEQNDEKVHKVEHKLQVESEELHQPIAQYEVRLGQTNEQASHKKDAELEQKNNELYVIEEHLPKLENECPTQKNGCKELQDISEGREHKSSKDAVAEFKETTKVSFFVKLTFYTQPKIIHFDRKRLRRTVVRLK